MAHDVRLQASNRWEKRVHSMNLVSFGFVLKCVLRCLSDVHLFFFVKLVLVKLVLVYFQ